MEMSKANHERMATTLVCLASDSSLGCMFRKEVLGDAIDPGPEPSEEAESRKLRELGEDAHVISLDSLHAGEDTALTPNLGTTDVHRSEKQVVDAPGELPQAGGVPLRLAEDSTSSVFRTVAARYPIFQASTISPSQPEMALK